MQSGAVPSNLRRVNERAIINLLMRMGMASRADLAKAARMSQPTAGKITSELLELGILQELDEMESDSITGTEANVRVGRPGRRLRLNAEQPRFLAIQLDVADTSISQLPVVVNQEDHWEVTFPTPVSATAWAQQLKKVAEKITPKSLWGVVLSVPGIVDEAHGRIVFSPNLHWTEKTNLTELIQKIWPLPVILVQEIRALALGQLSAEPETDSFLLLDVDQGVGGAIVEGGKLYRSPLPLNGELGHSPVMGNQRPCGCGAVGCVETLVSRRGILKSFAESGAAGPYSWTALGREISTNGLPTWLASSLEALGAIVAGAVNVLGLRRVIVTGCLTELPAAVMDHLAQAIQRGALWGRFGEVTCVAAPRRRAAGLAASGVDRLVFPMDKPDSLEGLPAAMGQ